MFRASRSIASMFQIAPRGPLYLNIGTGRLLECRHGGSPLVRKRIAALAGQPAVGERRFAGFRERGQRESPEAEFAAASMDEDALHPLLGPARLNQQIEAVSVAVAARLRDGAREGRRELVMRAFGLAFPACAAPDRKPLIPLIWDFRPPYRNPPSFPPVGFWNAVELWGTFRNGYPELSFYMNGTI